MDPVVHATALAALLVIMTTGPNAIPPPIHWHDYFAAPSGGLVAAVLGVTYPNTKKPAQKQSSEGMPWAGPKHSS